MTLTPEQQRVYEWLGSKLDVPVYAEAYRGALHLLKTKPPGYITFVATTGRDFMNGLAKEIAGIRRSQVQYVEHVGKLQDKWKDEWGGPGLMTRDNAEMGHLIPYNICKLVEDLIDDHKAGRERSDQANILFFTVFLDYEDREQIPRNFLKEWEKAKEWFRRHDHLRSSRFAEDVSTEVERHFRTLDGLLYVAASSEFERLRGIDAILEETNG